MPSCGLCTGQTARMHGISDLWGSRVMVLLRIVSRIPRRMTLCGTGGLQLHRHRCLHSKGEAEELEAISGRPSALTLAPALSVKKVAEGDNRVSVGGSWWESRVLPVFARSFYQARAPFWRFALMRTDGAKIKMGSRWQGLGP